MISTKFSGYLYKSDKATLRYYYFIFFIAFLTRLFCANFSGVENFSGSDWSRYDQFSDNIINGNFNLDTGLFITAPLYSYIVALFKVFLGSNFSFGLEIFQIILSSISVIFLSLTANLIFKNNLIAKLTAILFCFYPMTLYVVHLFSQESIFQSLLVISLYFGVRYQKKQYKRDLILFSLLISLTALTKSHILLAFPFILVLLMLNKKSLIEGFKDCIYFLFIFGILTLPNGLYNYKVNNIYTFSSSGAGAHFFVGHNDDVYKFIVDPPPYGSKEHTKLKSMDFEYAKKIKHLDGFSPGDRDQEFFRLGINWIYSNTEKNTELFFTNLKNFITPGVNKHHYPYIKWLLSFVICAPIFLLAYTEIMRLSIRSFSEHSFVIILFISMLIFSVLFYSQNRFRVITIEPWYLMYASSALINLLRSFFYIGEKN